MQPQRSDRKPQPAPKAPEKLLTGLVGRVAGGCLLVLMAFLWLSVISWHGGDPSFSNPNGGPIGNIGGPVGAILSDLALQAIGVAVVFALLPPTVFAFELIRKGDIRDRDRRTVAAGGAVLLIACAASAVPTANGWALTSGYGGILGDLLFGLMNSVLAVFYVPAPAAVGGLVSAAAGVVGLVRAIGLSSRDMRKIVTFEAKPRPEPVADSLPQQPRREPVLATVPAKAPAATPTAAAMAAPRAPMPAAPPPQRHMPPAAMQAPVGAAPQHQGAGRPHPGTAPPATWWPDQRPQPSSAHDPAPAHARPAPRPAPPAGAAPTGAPVSAATSAPASKPAAAPEPADDDPFDVLTDMASSQIASRFAPAGAQRPLHMASAFPPLPAPPMPHQLQQAVSSGFGSALLRPAEPPAYRLPSLNLLDVPAARRPAGEAGKQQLRGTAKLLEEVLGDFGVRGQIKDIRPGPVVTLYEFEPARGVKSARVIGLADDIARSMSAPATRISVLAGRNAIGIELPNATRETVRLREILETSAFKQESAGLPLALGRDIAGQPVVADLAHMPHLLVAGTTGSGKSVGINAMILSLLYRFTPVECRLLLIDPKMLELSSYNGVPHLLSPVIVDPTEAASALAWAVGEMEERYKRMAELGVRSLETYNNRVRHAKKTGEAILRRVQTGFDPRSGQPVYQETPLALTPLPLTVIVIDEFADLMACAGKDVEASVQRLAQKARAAGIHLIMATQRPSVDVVTGVIKANFPSRIAFKVASRVDSRTILDEQGAEHLLGQGDMLFSSGSGAPQRVHGAFVSEQEVEAITRHLREQGAPSYVPGIVSAATAPRETSNRMLDDLYRAAVTLVTSENKASTSYLQRRLAIGYNRAAELMERMEREGIVGPAAANGRREVLARPTRGRAGAA